MSDTMTAPDAFSMLALTKAINTVPFLPGLVGNLVQFEPRPGATLIASIEVRRNRLALVPSTVRGAAPTTNVEDRRQLIPFTIPHFPVTDTVMADSVQGVREFGSPTGLMSYEGEVQRRVESMSRKLDVTLEWLRFGCITGTIITRVDRDTGAPVVTIPLWAMFGIVQPAAAVFPIGPNGDPLDAASPWLANLTQAINDVTRRVENTLEIDVPGFAAICGATFFDSLVKHPEARDAYKTWAQDQASITVTRERNMRRPFHFRGVDWYEYRARVSQGAGGYMQFIDPATAQLLPLGVPDLFFEAYAPADWEETVNTTALPRYAKAERMHMGRGRIIEAQMNVLPMCSQPNCLIQLVQAP
jgi:hypothetical protein